MAYALVRYLSDGKEEVVPIRYVCDYDCDEPGACYRVFWSPSPMDTFDSFLQSAKEDPTKLIALDNLVDAKNSSKSVLSGYYNAVVIKIGDNKKDLEHLEKKGKPGRPSKNTGKANCTGTSNPSVNPKSDLPIPDEEAKKTKKSLAEQKKKHKSLVSTSLKAQSERLLMMQPRALKRSLFIRNSDDSELSSDSLEDGGEVVPQKLYNNLKKDFNVQGEKLKYYKEKLATKIKEADRLRDANLHLQEMLFAQVGGGGRNFPITSTPVAGGIRINTNEGVVGLPASPILCQPTVTPQARDADEAAIDEFTVPEVMKAAILPHGSTSRQNGSLSIDEANEAIKSGVPHNNAKVRLGAGIVDVGFDSYTMAQKVKRGTDGDSMFIKNYATMIWGSADLVNRSVTGQRCVAIKGSSAKAPLTPEKLLVIHTLLKKRMDGEVQRPSAEEQKARLNSISKVMSDKIMTLKRAQKKK